MGKGSPFKILASMAIGFALAAVGMDTVTGQLRLTVRHPRPDARLRLPDRR
jgi:putative tricarboxylic transport membrane protein